MTKLEQLMRQAESIRIRLYNEMQRCNPHKPSLKNASQLKQIRMAVCDYFKMPIDVIAIRCNEYRYTLPRFIAFKLSREQNIPLTHIGIEYGRDHGAVSNGIDRINGWIECDKEVARMVGEIKSKIQ